MDMSTVYVLSNQLKVATDGRLVPKFNFQSASQYGDIEIVLDAPVNNTLDDPVRVVEELHDKLCQFTTDDYLLPIGNPVLIGWATTIAAFYSRGEITLLSWDRKNKKYQPITAELT